MSQQPKKGDIKSYDGFKVGDIVLRKGERCKIMDIDFHTNPPSVTVQMVSDPTRLVGTEFVNLTKIPATMQQGANSSISSNLTIKDISDSETKQKINEIENQFLGISIADDNDLPKIVPAMLPNLLFKLNGKNLNQLLQSKLIELISHISKRVQGFSSHINEHDINDIVKLIPNNVLLKMLYDHLAYKRKDSKFHLSPFFVNLTLTFIVMGIKNTVLSLSIQDSNNNNANNGNKKKVSNSGNKNGETLKQRLDVETINWVFKCLCFMDDILTESQNIQLFHAFIAILPYINYSTNKLDENVQLFSSLFEINGSDVSSNRNSNQSSPHKTNDKNDKNEESKSQDTDMSPKRKKLKKKVESKSEDSDQDTSDDEDSNDDIDITMNADVTDLVKQHMLNKPKNGNDNETENDENEENNNIHSKGHILKLISFIEDFMLCKYITQLPPTGPARGLSVSQHKNISSNYKLLQNKMQLEKTQKSMMDFLYHIGLMSNLISKQELYIPCLIGCNNGNGDVVSRASEKILGKISNKINLENEKTVKKLFTLYLGTTAKNVPNNDKRTPVEGNLKLAIVESFLCKSVVACNEFPLCIQIVFDCLFGKKTFERLRIAGLEYTNAIFRKGSDNEKFGKLTPIFKKGLLKLLNMDPESPDHFLESSKIRNIAYTTIAHLASLSNGGTKLFVKDLAILELYFSRLLMENDSMLRESILDGLKMLHSAYMQVSHLLKDQLLAFLFSKMEIKQQNDGDSRGVSRMKMATLEWLNTLFPFDNSKIRLVNLLQLDSSDTQVKEYAKKSLLPRIEKIAIENNNASDEKTNENEKFTFRMQKYPNFEEFVEIAHQKAINSKHRLSKEIMREIIDFGAKCLSANARLWYEQEKEKNEIKLDTNILLQWLESNDGTSEFRNEQLYLSLKKQFCFLKKEYINTSDNSNVKMGSLMTGIEKYLSLILNALTTYPVSMQKTKTLDSVSLEHLNEFLCIFYPFITNYKEYKIDNGISKLFENCLFLKDNLNAFYGIFTKNGIIARMENSKFWALLTIIDLKLHENYNTTNEYTSQLIEHVGKHFATKSLATKDTSTILDGTVQQVNELDGCIRGIGTILSAKLIMVDQNDKNAITLEFSNIAWLCTIFSFSSNLDIIDASCFSISMFAKYQCETLLSQQSLVDLSAKWQTNNYGLLNVSSNPLNSITKVISLFTRIDSSNDKSKSNTDSSNEKKENTESSIVNDNENDDSNNNKISTFGNVSDISQYLILTVRRYNKEHRTIAEGAISGLSAIARGSNSLKQLTEIEDSVYQLKNLSQEELQFAIGSVWANIVMSAENIPIEQEEDIDIDINMEKKSNEMIVTSDSSENNNNNDNKKEKRHVEVILDKICFDFMRYGNALTRSAACSWLLCIVRFAGKLNTIQKQLLTIQNAFINALSDSKQFTVECASKGLAHCYEMSKNNKNEKASDILVSNLMSTLGKGKRIVHKDTEVTTKQGSSTYKELCNIANNLNQPDLAYKFLDLAANHAVWNSKRGAAFSLGSLLQVSDKLTKEIDSVLPILFRYRYDVNPSVRNTMENLWKSVVQNNEEKYMKQHYSSIMKLTIEGLQSKEWRIRAASPLAASELINGKRMKDVEPYFGQLWENLFLVIDDINTMVKKSGVTMMQRMIQLTQRLVDPNMSSVNDVEKALAILMPILFKTGIDVKAQAVQALSIFIIVKICQRSGKYLKPYLSEMVKLLLFGLSTLEPSQLLYFASQDQGSQFSSNVENARLELAKNNPLNGALDSCIELIDKDTIDNIIPELTSIIKTGVGLPSINAACNILNKVSDDYTLHKVLKKHSKRVIQSICNRIPHTNSSHLRNLYSTVLGHWALFGKEKYVDMIMKLIETLYFEENDKNDSSNVDGRLVSGLITFSIARYALVTLNKYPNILSLGFVASHDSHEEINKEWNNAMDEIGGRSMFVKKQMNLVSNMIIKVFNHQNYQIKLCAIKSVSTLADTSHDDLEKELLYTIIKELLNGLPGRIWDGKIEIFNSLIHVCKHCNVLLNDEIRQLIINSLLIEIDRKKLDYRCNALNCIGEISQIFDKIVIVNEIAPKLNSIFDVYNKFEENEMKESSVDKETKLQLKENIKKQKELLNCALRCLGNIWNGDLKLQKQHLSWIVSIYNDYLNRPSSDWMVKIAIYKSMQSFCKRLNIEAFDTSDKIENFIRNDVLLGLNDLKFAPVRHQCLCVLYDILKLGKYNEKQILTIEFMQNMKDTVDKIVNNEQKPLVVQQAIKIRKDIF